MNPQLFTSSKRAWMSEAKQGWSRFRSGLVTSMSVGATFISPTQTTFSSGRYSRWKRAFILSKNRCL
ncbi:hypothetical protein MASR2M17_09190 [Aminivibrio sp.]